MERFNRSLNNNRRIVMAPLWNYGDRMRVRAFGVLHPKEFERQFSPMEYSSNWGSITDEELHHNVRYRMRDLEESIRKTGVLRPIIAGQVPEDFPDWRHHSLASEEAVHAVPYVQKFPVIDGHHRAVAAMRVGANIPVFMAAENLINRIRPGDTGGRLERDNTPNAGEFRSRMSEFRRSL